MIWKNIFIWYTGILESYTKEKWMQLIISKPIYGDFINYVYIVLFETNLYIFSDKITKVEPSIHPQWHNSHVRFVKKQCIPESIKFGVVEFSLISKLKTLKISG